MLTKKTLYSKPTSMLNSLKRAGLREAARFTSRASVQATMFNVLIVILFEQRIALWFHSEVC